MHAPPFFYNINKFLSNQGLLKEMWLTHRISHHLLKLQITCIIQDSIIKLLMHQKTECTYLIHINL